MWISRVAFDHLCGKTVKAEAVVADLRTHIVQLSAMNDWLKMRLTQLEHERAVLVQNYMGVKIPVPEIMQETPKLSDVLGETVSFDDMGDAAAAREGVGWNEAGEVTYGKK